MGFKLSKDMAEKVAKIALTMGNNEEAVEIPDSKGQVLVRHGTKAFLERNDSLGIFMIPVVLKTVINGIETEQLFVVCTQ